MSRASGALETWRGRYEQALAQSDMVATLAQEIGFWRGQGLACWVRGAVALARGTYAQAWQWLGEGAALGTAGKLDEVGYALALLGIAACRLGHPSRARQYVQEAMGMAAETESFPIVLHGSGLSRCLSTVTTVV